jgi:competence protein ComEC
MASLFHRYGLLILCLTYSATLVVLHTRHRLPAAGIYDLSRLIPTAVLTVEGKIADFPQARWGQTRFLFDGRAVPQSAFRGKILVQLHFVDDDLAPGDTLRLRGWLTALRTASGRKRFDERAYWNGYGAFAVLHVWDHGMLTRQIGGRSWRWEAAAWKLHRTFRGFWFDQLAADQAALISCMSMGSRGVLSADLKQDCIRAGVYHLLVVSGQNVALVISLIVTALGWVRIPRRLAIWFCGLPILFYCSAVGADPPVVRASAMALVGLALTALRRDVPSYCPLLIAWMWIALRDPNALFGASFQLSFAATLSLWVVWPQIGALSRIKHRMVRWLAQTAAISLVVHLGVWPLLAHYFHQLSLAGLLISWAVFPFVGGLMVVGLILGCWGVFAPTDVPYIGIETLRLVLDLMLWLIRKISSWPWSVVQVPPISTTACVAYYVTLIVILWLFLNAKKQTVLQQSRRRL